MMTLMIQTLIGVTILLVASLLLYFGLRSCKTGASLRHGVLATVLGGTLVLPCVMPFVPMRVVVKSPEKQETTVFAAPRPVPEFLPPRRDEYLPPPVLGPQEIEERQIARAEEVIRETVVAEKENVVEPVEEVAFNVTPPIFVDVDTVPQAARSTVSRAALWVAWCLGTMFFLLRFARSVVISRRILDKTMPVDDPEFAMLLKRFGLQNVALRRSEVGVVPFTQGVLRPVVVLPETADRWTSEERQAVLTHELAHVKRRDVLGQMFAELCRAVYWFHPLVWLAVRQIRIEREFACDDLVVSAGENPPVYASVLLRIAADLKSVPRRSVVLGCSVAMARRHEVKGRIAAILNPNRVRKPLGKLGSIGVVLSVCAGVTLAAMLTPEEEKAKDSTPSVDASNVVDVSQPSENIVVEVFDTAGKPIPGAKLSLFNSPTYPRAEEFIADGEGRIELPYTKYFSPRNDTAFMVTAPGYITGFRSYQRRMLQPYVEIPDKLTFNLEKGVTISGQIVDQDDKPLADQEVRIFSTDSPYENVKMYLKSRHPDLICRTDAHGRFQCDTISPHVKDVFLQLVEYDTVVFRCCLDKDGEHSLASALDGTLKLKANRTFTTDGKAEIDKLPVFRVGGVIFDSQGKPVTDAIVKSLLGNSDSGETTTSDAEGRFECFSPTPMIRLLVFAKDFVPAQVKIPFPGTEGVKEIKDGVVSLNEVEVQLYPGRQVTINVVDTEGKPIADAEVLLGYFRKTSSYQQTRELEALPGATDENGEFTCRSSGAADEILRFEIRHPEYRSQEMFISPLNDLRYRFMLRKTLIVSGKVIDADTKEPIKDFLTIHRDFGGTRDFETLKRDYGRHWTDGTGRYSVTFGRDAFAYDIDVLAKGYAKSESRTIYRSEKERQTLDFELKKNAWGAAKDPDKPTVLLTLVDENNHPIPHGKGRLARYPLPRGYNAESYMQDFRWFEKQATSAYDFTADADGKVEILLPKQEKLYAYRIQTTTPGYVPYDSFFDENSLAAKLEIRTSSTKTIGGVVRDSDGNPVTGAEVELTVVYSVSPQNQSIPPSLVPAGFFKAKTDANGQWKMEGIPTDQILYEKYIPRPKITTQSYLETVRPRRLFFTHPSYKTTPVEIELRKLLPSGDGEYEYGVELERK